MALSAGQIAFVAHNADGTDSFSFVVLGNIAAGEVVNFTDDGWTAAGAFRTGEGTIAWTAPAGGVAAGTVVTLTATTASVGALATITSGFNFTTAGDGVIAYQGASSAPTFIAALNNDGTTWQADAVDTSTSALPTGLIDGETAIAINEIDNTSYNGPTTGNVAYLRAALMDLANWGLRSDTTQQTGPASFTIQDVPTAVNDFFVGTNGADTIDMLAGDDFFSGGDGNDIITGGAGVDDLAGGEGDDQFVVRAGDTVTGDSYDGGNGSDSIEVQGGGTVSLVGATLTSVETINSDGNNTRLVLATNAQLGLLGDMAGANDVVELGRWAGGQFNVAELFTVLQGANAEAVEWSGAASDFVATFDAGTGFVTVVATDSTGTSSAPVLTRVYDADGDMRQHVTEFADGAVRTYNYDANGVMTDMLIDAAGAGRTYQSILATYTDGKLASNLQIASDGIRTEIGYDTSGPASIITSKLVTDVNNVKNWSTIEETFDGTGQIATRQTTYDAGAINVDTFTYSGGVIQGRTTEYADGRESVSLYSAGQLQSTITTYADGRMNIIGGAGDNTLAGGTENDTFRGAGGSDVFDFAGTIGDDRISDFTNGFDTLDFSDYGITDMASLGSAASQVGRNVVIDLGADGSVTLMNFQLSNLDDSDFFVA